MFILRVLGDRLGFADIQLLIYYIIVTKKDTVF